MRYRHSFSAGPGALPDGVMRETREALEEVPEVGLSLLGISHRSAWFRDVVAEAEDHFRRLLGIPDGSASCFSRVAARSSSARYR